MTNFRRGPQPEQTSMAAEFARIAALSLDEKEQLCLDLLNEFGASNITRSGHELRHSCSLPYGLHAHGDRNPSASLNFSKLTYVCYGGCGSGGLLWWIATCRDTSTTEAFTHIATKVGIGDPQSLADLLAYIDSLFADEPMRDNTIPTMSPRVLQPWSFVHPYLTELRGIPEQSVIDMRVGWDPDHDRIVIPHFWRGDLVGWQTRRLSDDGTPKYKNSIAMPKDRTLYNADGIDLTQPVVVVESPMTVLALRHEVPNIVATFGATVTDRQVSLLARYPHVVLWFDNDSAGWEVTSRVGSRLLPYSRVDVVDSPYAGDGADLGPEVSVALIEGAVASSLWRRPTQVIEEVADARASV